MRAIFRVMVLGLWRDRGALLMAFALPSLVFAIFASIFSGATEGDLHLRVGLVVETEDQQMQEFAQYLTQTEELEMTALPDSGRAQLREQVQQGNFDTGVIVHGQPDTDNDPLFTIVSEPTREIAALSLQGWLRQSLVSQQPQVLVQRLAQTTEALVEGFSPEQQARLDAALEAMARDPGEAAIEDLLIELDPVYGEATASISGLSGIAYYAGATAILFLLLSAVNAGMVSLEERQNGIAERLLLSKAAHSRLLLGRFLFLLSLGFFQASAIFLVARFGFGLEIERALAKVIVMAIACAAASAGLALLLLSLCRTTQQATTFSSFFVLIVSSVGGSMVPRFMMPDWLQTVSLFTPNAWAIEGFYGALIRGDSWAQLAQPGGILAAVALVSLLLAALPLFKTPA
ncbi:MULTISPECIES: ABC transporter permease [Halomonadaceae]|uniref:ABC transporter permease n=1 Tax=Halomonadaceae TaxID=28256 RepID=UPI0018EF9644|nr:MULTISPECIES: ABC transporter permease [Halomonas]MCW4149928.1 ABC transporter permease [Halomonas sp. 18H]MDR5886493.1 ABC transporter permease [Halomonas janggokensis]QPL46949.1 ABC transporter permease [Halomonas sp. A40-4]